MLCRRSHPLTVFFSLKKYFWLTALPVIRAMLLYGMPPEQAFAGFWADILLAGLILLSAVIKRRTSYLGIDNERVEYKSGLLLKRRIPLGFDDISCVRITQTPFTAAFGCYKLEIYTRAALKPAIISYADRRTAARIARGRRQVILKTDTGQNIAHSLLSADGVGGLLIISAVLSAIGVAVGKGINELIQENIGAIPARLELLPGLLMAAAIAVFAGWLVSFAAQIMSNADFTLSKGRRGMSIKRGAFICRRLIITQRPEYMLYSYTAAFDKLAVYAGAAGCEDEPVVPYCAPNIAKSINDISPAAKGKAVISTNKQPLRYFILMPSVMFIIACGLSAMAVWCGLFGGMNYAAVLLPLPFLLNIFYGVSARRHTAVYLYDRTVSAVCCRRSKRRTAVFDKSSVGKITVYRKAFRRRQCDVRIFLPYEKKEKLLLKRIPPEAFKNEKNTVIFP